jgi:hypothetical protein
MKNIDFVIGKNLLQSNPPALEYFLESEIKDITPESQAILEDLEVIHDHGRLTRVIIPEFQKLSGLYPSEPDSSVQKETINFVKMLGDFEKAPQGSTGITPSYSGEYLQLSIVAVGKGVTLTTQGILPHFKYIKEEIGRGIKNFYIVAAGNNCFYAKQLKIKACRDINLNVIFEEEYIGKFRGDKRKMYCTLCVLSEKIETA